MFFSTHRDASQGKLLTDEDDWGGWNEDNSDWNNADDADDKQALEDWLNDDTSQKSSKKKPSKSKKTSDGWDDWDQIDGKDKKTLKSSQNLKKKESLKTKSSSSEGWSTEDWGEFSSKTSAKEPKEPLVGNLLDLDINDSTSKTDQHDGIENDIWADVDDDDWQSLEIESVKQK